jgi:hypothetical protein
MERVTIDGVSLKLWKGDRIQDAKRPHLKGKIADIEWHDSGKPSAVPYRVDWDNEDLARRERGMFYFWATADCLEKES